MQDVFQSAIPPTWSFVSGSVCDRQASGSAPVPVWKLRGAECASIPADGCQESGYVSVLMWSRHAGVGLDGEGDDLSWYLRQINGRYLVGKHAHNLESFCVLILTLGDRTTVLA
jgi:hypothetical protein